MTYLIPIAAGFFGAYIIACLKDTGKKEKILSVICLVLILVLLAMYGKQDTLHIAISYVFLIISMVSALLFKGRLVTLYEALKEACAIKASEKEKASEKDKTPVRNEEDLTEEEEEEMKKQQKIITVLCVVLILYMIVSTFCIYRLNSKINTLYDITMEQDK